MISRLEGELADLRPGALFVRIGPAVVEVLTPACDDSHWSGRLGAPVQLHTLMFLEAIGQGTAFIPRLLGFRSAGDREFFSLFTTVKGIGNRKALRAMASPPGAIARAIAGRDLAWLVTLPEIGKRSAETIVAQLHGKVDAYLTEHALDITSSAEGRSDGAAYGGSGRPTMARDALTVLTRLGESQQQAARWIDQVIAQNPEITDAEALITEVYRIRQ